jgi:lactate dehydrogenase-like 2-hydroxyacid dehydrogenase
MISSSTSTIPVLILSEGVPRSTVSKIVDPFEALVPAGHGGLRALLDAHGSRIRAIATTGKAKLDRAILDQLPALEIVACYSAGLDNIDTVALAERGIPLTNSSAALADEVADLAIALMIMARRRLPIADRYIRDGDWHSGAFPLGQSSRGKRIGLLGLGHIGAGIARRAIAMGMAPRYCTRRRIEGCPFPYYSTPKCLASDSDVFVVACPGGAANRHLVSAEVIAALRPESTLINIARGEIVDEAALVASLVSGRLGSAGLDVFEDEPNVPETLRRLVQVTLTPHLGSATVETRDAMEESVVAALTGHFRIGLS